MIHLGSLVGAGISQFQSKTLGIKLPFFQRFRNPEDRRNFISAGAAAGIASAFGAPVGGLLFAMEEVSSFWNLKLSWQVFFCSMVSTFTTDLFNSAFQGFRYTGDFGLFKTSKYILFQIEDGIDLNILGLIPSVILGILGGLFGSLFILLNLKLARLRLRVLGRLGPHQARLARLLEPVLIILASTSLAVLVPALFPCTPVEGRVGRGAEQVLQPGLERYSCPGNNTYNQAATLFFVTGERAIQQLFRDIIVASVCSFYY